MRRLLIGITALVVLLAAVVVIVPAVIPASTYEARVAAAVKQATGRDLVFGGPVSLHLLPSAALTAQDVTLSNAPGAGDRNMVSLAKLEVGLKLGPLLSGEVEFTRLVLTRPVIHLEIDKAGQGNWMFRPEAGPERSAAAPKTNATADRLKQLHLGTVTIEEGTVTYLDQRTGKRQELGKVDADVTLDSLDRPLTLKGSAGWRGQVASVDFRADKAGVLVDGGATPVTLQVSAPSVKLDYAGSLALKPLKADGKLDVSGSSLRALIGWTGTPMKSGAGFGAFSVQGSLAASARAVELSGAALALDSIRATGEVGVDLGRPRPVVKAGLSFAALDLDPYMPAGAPPAEAAQKPIAAPATPGAGWSRAPIDLAPARAADAALAITLPSLRLGRIELGRSVIAVALDNGRIAIAFKQVALYGGAGTGQVMLDGSGPVPALSASLALSSIQLQPALSAVLGVEKLSGTAGLNLTISAHGRNQLEMMQSVGERGLVQVANGAIKGVDLAAIARDVATVLGKGTATVPAGQTNFSTASGTFTISSGVLSNSDLVASSPLLGLTGTGSADLVRRTIDYRLEPSLAGNLQGGRRGIAGTTVPIVVQGPWDNPTYRPDVASIIQQRLSKANLKGTAGKLLGNGGSGKPGDWLKSVFGK